MPPPVPPDPVPLGVGGTVAVSRADYLRLTGDRPTEIPLLDDPARLAYLARRIAAAMHEPIGSPGSHHLAGLVLDHLDVDGPEILAEKALQTVRDGETHSRMVFGSDTPLLAAQFVTWNGTHRELQAERYGHYLSRMFFAVDLLRRRGAAPAGLLQVDAFLLDEPDPRDPGRLLDEVVMVGVEYSYLPGTMLGAAPTGNKIIDFTLLINAELLDAEERQQLSALMA